MIATKNIIEVGDVVHWAGSTDRFTGVVVECNTKVHVWWSPNHKSSHAYEELRVETKNSCVTEIMPGALVRGWVSSPYRAPELHLGLVTSVSTVQWTPVGHAKVVNVLWDSKETTQACSWHLRKVESLDEPS